MLIALVGNIGCGKNTLADQLVAEYGFIKFSFAACLKDVVSVMFGWDRQMVEGVSPQSREWRETVDEWWGARLGVPNFTPRLALQMIGTNVIRCGFHPDFWVIHVEKEIRKLLAVDPTISIVVSDCRFENEARMIRTFGGRIVRILHLNPAPITHESEQIHDICVDFECIGGGQTVAADLLA